MLDHIFLTVSDVDRSVAFYEKVLPHIGIDVRHDYDGKDAEVVGKPDRKIIGPPSLLSEQPSVQSFIRL